METNTNDTEAKQPCITQLARQISQDGYIIAHPSKDPNEPPQVEAFRLTAQEALEKARSLASEYGTLKYPNGLMVLDCKVLFNVRNETSPSTGATEM